MTRDTCVYKLTYTYNLIVGLFKGIICLSTLNKKKILKKNTKQKKKSNDIFTRRIALCVTSKRRGRSPITGSIL